MDREYQLGETTAHNASMPPAESDGHPETRKLDSHETGEPARATVYDSLIPTSTDSLNSQKKAGVSSGSVIYIILGSWWLELLCLGIVVLALVAIALTLSTQQGRPLPHWPYKISVNSLVSAYVVILKGAMLLIITEGISQLKWTWYKRRRPLEDFSRFDSASRGPWGAFLLIWTLRGRHIVAMIGAFVVIVALVIDPVVQLLVRYYSCSIELGNTTANIPRKNAFSEMGRHSGAGISDLTYEFQSAINAGLFNPEAVNIPFTCPTGNCTFDEAYHTVAYCSSCTETTYNLTGSCWPSNETIPTWRCSTTLIGGPSVVSEGHNTEYLKIATQPLAENYSIVAANLSNVYDGNCSTAAENATWSCKGQGAAVCSLYPCIRSYKASVNAGKLEETFLSSTTKMASSSQYGAFARVALDVRCLSPDERKSLIDIGYKIDETTDWLGYSDEGHENISSSNPGGQEAPNITISSNCTYAFSETSLMSVDNFMDSFLNGTITTDPSSPYYYITTGPVQMQKFFNYGNISFEYINNTFSGIADSMTAYMRQDAKSRSNFPGDGVTMPAIGHVFRVETCISVRWAYMAVPAALVLLTLVFFIAVLIETVSQHRQHDWKSSPLALLFHGLDLETRNMQGEAETLSEMESAAKQMKVRFRKMDRGWGFSQAN